MFEGYYAFHENKYYWKKAWHEGGEPWEAKGLWASLFFWEFIWEEEKLEERLLNPLPKPEQQQEVSLKGIVSHLPMQSRWLKEVNTQNLYLNLRHGKISQLHPNITRFDKLASLDLSHNQLTDLPKNFQALENLVILRLAYNKMTRLSAETLPLTEKTKLDTLDLEGNPALQELPGILKNQPKLKAILIGETGISQKPEVLEKYKKAFQNTPIYLLEGINGANPPVKKFSKEVEFEQEDGSKVKKQLTMEFSLIAGGTFLMGDNWGNSRELLGKELGEKDHEWDLGKAEFPQHTVTVTSFWLAQTTVTLDWFRCFVENTWKYQAEQLYKYDPGTGGITPFRNERGWELGVNGDTRDRKLYAQHPVLFASWKDAESFAQWFSKHVVQEGMKAHTPTEAQWEFAAKNRSAHTQFSTGKEVLSPAEANFDARESYQKHYSLAGEFRADTLVAGSLPPSAQGIYQLTGNVAEWCQDCMGYYLSDVAPNAEQDLQLAFPQLNPCREQRISGRTEFRVARGGSWNYFPIYCRSSYRNFNQPMNGNNNIGFRLAL